MSIQWFPGHMTKARKVIADALPNHDVIVEVVDARMPRASENPMLGELCAHKARVLVLNKSDLADPVATEAWMKHYEQRSAASSVPRVPIAISTKKTTDVRSRLPELCKKLTPRSSEKSVRVMIVGIPNVGKSTLVNTLLGRSVAKVGNEPAVTKAKQQVVLSNGITLSDHPGLMWPKIAREEDAFKLALGGAIADNALEYESLGLFAVCLFSKRYPKALLDRYKLDALGTNADETLRAIVKKRGCLEKGGIVNLMKAGDIVVHDFRNGALGRITVELP